MYCKNCGKEVNDNAVVCIHCGCALDKTPSYEVQTTGVSKKGIGIALGILLGLLGLLIGFLIYNHNEYEKQTFIKGWVTGFVITLVISVVLGLIIGGATSCLMLEYLFITF